MTKIIYSIAVPAPITPTEPLPPLPEIPRGSLVVVEGRAPAPPALHLHHSPPAAAIRLSSILGPGWSQARAPPSPPGQVIEMTLPAGRAGGQEGDL